MTAPQFENEVSSELEGVTDLVLDLKQLSYISSAGLRVLMVLMRTMKDQNGILTVCYPSEDVLDVFTATRLVDYLNIEQ